MHMEIARMYIKKKGRDTKIKLINTVINSLYYKSYFCYTETNLDVIFTHLPLLEVNRLNSIQILSSLNVLGSMASVLFITECHLILKV